MTGTCEKEQANTALFEEMQRQSIKLDTVMNNAMTSTCEKGMASTERSETMRRGKGIKPDTFMDKAPVHDFLAGFYRIVKAEKCSARQKEVHLARLDRLEQENFLMLIDDTAILVGWPSEVNQHL